MKIMGNKFGNRGNISYLCNKKMDWNYISGFFDADGSITFARVKKDGLKTLQVSFSNNELCILESIQQFIVKELGIKGFISRKTPRKNTHGVNYELKYHHLGKCLPVLGNIKSNHPKKRHRIKVAFEFKAVTPRNGKYNEKLLKERDNIEELFFKF